MQRLCPIEEEETKFHLMFLVGFLHFIRFLANYLHTLKPLNTFCTQDLKFPLSSTLGKFLIWVVIQLYLPMWQISLKVTQFKAYKSQQWNCPPTWGNYKWPTTIGIGLRTQTCIAPSTQLAIGLENKQALNKCNKLNAALGSTRL
jgi:hypothetical protein